MQWWFSYAFPYSFICEQRSLILYIIWVTYLQGYCSLLFIKTNIVHELLKVLLYLLTSLFLLMGRFSDRNKQLLVSLFLGWVVYTSHVVWFCVCVCACRWSSSLHVVKDILWWVRLIWYQKFVSVADCGRTYITSRHITLSKNLRGILKFQVPEGW
jgi:hypothetical protein